MRTASGAARSRARASTPRAGPGASRTKAQVAPASVRLEAGGEEETEPRPHRVELPHVAEVAEAGQPGPALVEDGARHAQIEARGGKAIGPLRDAEPEEQSGEEGKARRSQ